MKRIALVVVAVVACGLLVVGCGAGGGGGKAAPGDRSSDRVSAAALKARKPVAVVIGQATRPGWTNGPETTVVTVVRLGGQVSTLPIDVPYPIPPAYAPALSPDGTRLLYRPVEWSQVPTSPVDALDVVDLASKTATTALPYLGPSQREGQASSVGPQLLAAGWDPQGNVVALTAVVRSQHRHGPGRYRDYVEMTLRRGAPGKMTSEAVAPAPTYDITRFVAADTRSAWFIGETRGLSFTPTTQHLLRCDYGSHKLVSLGTIAGSDAGTPGVGQKNARFLDSPVSAPPSAEEVLAFGLPVVRTEIHTNNDAGREYFNALRGVELHRLSDFHTERTIAVTSSTSPGNRVETNQWGLALHGVPKGTAGIGPEGLPLTGDWGMPVFDADYSHYLRSRAVTGGAELRAYDAASAVPTTLVAEPDPYVAPLGYVDSQGTALYVASDTKRLSVVRGAALFLHEPGKGPRLLARLPFVPTDRFPVFHPMLLGVVYER